MNILMVTHYFDSHGGGVELVARRIFRGLATSQDRMVWAAADVSAPPEEGPHTGSLRLQTWNAVERFTGVPFPVPSLRALRKLQSAVRGADLLLLHDCLYLSNIAAYLFAWMRGIPVLIVQHIGIVPYKNRILRGVMSLANAIITRPMLSSAQQVVFISDTTKRYFSSLRFSRPVITIFNGVDCDTFRPPRHDENRLEIRERLRLPREKPVALFVGRFVPKKGLAILRKMAVREPGITWAFAGTGPLDPAAWGLGNVRVFSDLHDAGLAELYRASDVFVLPSMGEGFPLVLQEALASGLPLVCGSDTAGADQAFIQFARGVDLAKDDDELSATRFLAGVNEVLSTTTSAAAAQRQYEFARARYSWQVALRRYFEAASALVSEFHPAQVTANPAKVRSAYAAGNTTQGQV